MMYSHKKILSILGIGVGLLVTCFVPHAFAEGAGADAVANLGEPMLGILVFVSSITTVLQALLFIILWILQFLLSSQWFLDENMLGALNSIWVLSRDIMNIIFALMLIGVAFYTIITAKKEFVSSKIVNFVLAVILVNFSWFFPRVIIDVANIMTATVYSIPNMLPANFQCSTPPEKPGDAPGKCAVLTDAMLFPKDETKLTYCPGGKDSATCSCSLGIVCYKMTTYEDALTNLPTAHVMLNGLAVNFVRLQTLIKIPLSPGPGPAGAGLAAAAGGKGIPTQMIVAIFTVFLVQVFLILPLVALGVGLLMRILVLWITIAFMPFAFLGFVINDRKLGTGVFGMEDYIWKNFIDAAFLPVQVAIPITIGLTMLSAVSKVTPPTGGLEFDQPIIFGVSSWWALLWMAAAVGIIWTGAFAALSKNNFTKGASEKIKGFGSQIGGAVAKAPLLMPLPLPGLPKGSNVGTLYNAPKSLNNIMDDKIRKGSLENFNEQARGGSGGENKEKVNAGLSDAKPEIGKLAEAVRAFNAATTAAKRDEEKEKMVNIVTKIEGGNVHANKDDVLDHLKRFSENAGAANSKLKDLGREITEAIEKNKTPL